MAGAPAAQPVAAVPHAAQARGDAEASACRAALARAVNVGAVQARASLAKDVVAGKWFQTAQALSSKCNGRKKSSNDSGVRAAPKRRTTSLQHHGDRQRLDGRISKATCGWGTKS